MKTLRCGALATIIAVLSLAACGDAPPDDGYAAVGVCGSMAQPVIRVDDDACPAGDVVVPGWPYRWYYLPMDRGAPDVDVVYVGIPLDMDTHHHTHYVIERPARVTSSVQIVRGAPRDARSAPATSGATATAAKVAQKPSRHVERGGFGVPQGRAAEAPRAGSSKSAPRVAPAAPRNVRVASPEIKAKR